MSETAAKPLSDVEMAIEALDEVEMERVQHWGGYPNPIINYPPSWVTIVDCEDGEVNVRFYREETVVKWHKAVRRLMRKDKWMDIALALGETCPDEDRE